MFPGGMNPKQMKAMMSRMGIKTEELKAERVVIYTGNVDVVIEDPEVMKMTVQGQTIYNITGGCVREEPAAEKNIKTDAEAGVDFTEDDVRFVSEQSGRSLEDARKILEETGGDIVEAIIRLRNNKV